MNNINLFDYALETAKEINSLYSGNRFDKSMFLEFLDANSWFDIPQIFKSKAPAAVREDAEKIRDSLILWLSAYKQPDSVKLSVLLAAFENIYPETCGFYRDFVAGRKLESAAYAWKLADYLFANIDKEITCHSESELDALAKKLDTAGSLAAARLFAEFLQTGRSGDSFLDWDYDFYSRRLIDSSNTAYSVKDFAVMAYCVFNEDAWRENDMISKAVKSRHYADLWLYTAIHFVCALRRSDLIRLPAPSLPYDREQIFSDISEGRFSIEAAAAITDELCIRTGVKPLKPSKTIEYDNISEIKLFVPESLRKPLGVIIAIALAHHSEIETGDSFIFPSDNNISTAGKFFGRSFSNAAGGRHLSTRRCNKSYLQGIEAVYEINDAAGSPKGYMLAALARSHKGGIGRLPEITDVYLKDANFTGYTPEFIAREMFERGVFSFIPSVLLEMYAGNDFKRLSVRNQTALIKNLGLKPIEIEKILDASEISLQNAKKVVAETLSGHGKERISSILQNIASGNAPSLQSEFLCLMTAAGFGCPHFDRSSCIGCKYEIYTKSAMSVLMREFARIKNLRDDSPPSDAWRYTAILENSLLPAVGEIISCAKLYAQNNDIAGILDIAERGIELC